MTVSVTFICNDFKSDFTCGSEPCYEKSKRKKQVCHRIFDNDGRSVFDYFSSKLGIPALLPFIMVAILVWVATSAVARLVINYTWESTVNTNKGFCHSERNNRIGDLFSSSMFLLIICLLNFHSFNPKSFCLMNPLEKMCDPYRESLSCAHTNNLNMETEMGNYFDGYAGFFRRKPDEGLSETNPLKCFLDIGRNSSFQFLSLDFGKNNRWTESSFVLIDGELAPFQPNTSFKSLPRINFAWLLNQNIPINLGQGTTSTGILVFAADSNVELFYHNARMTGME